MQLTYSVILDALQNEFTGNGILNSDCQGRRAWQMAVRPVIMTGEIVRPIIHIVLAEG